MYKDYLDKFSKYDKLTKTQAKKVLDLGGIIIIAPCKCNVLGLFSMQVKKADIIENYGSFENLINHFSYYNCNSELGKKPSFYIL